MRAKDVRDLSDQELTTRVSDLQEALFRFRLRRGTNQLENPAALAQTRRDIARIRTIQAERQRAAAGGK